MSLLASKIQTFSYSREIKILRLGNSSRQRKLQIKNVNLHEKTTIIKLSFLITNSAFSFLLKEILKLQ